MEAIIHNFRGGVKTHYANQLILIIPSITSREAAEKLSNKKVIWQTPSGKEIQGKISKPHGNKGAVRAIFERGLPGQALATKVKIE